MSSCEFGRPSHRTYNCRPARGRLRPRYMKVERNQEMPEKMTMMVKSKVRTARYHVQVLALSVANGLHTRTIERLEH